MVRAGRRRAAMRRMNLAIRLSQQAHYSYQLKDDVVVALPKQPHIKHGPTPIKLLSRFLGT